MFEKRSVRTPITLGVILIVLIVVLVVLWVVGNWIVATGTSKSAFTAMLVLGIVLLAGVLAGVIAYLTMTVRAFRLNQRQSNFIDSVTHELKSPIASLKLYLQTMSRRTVDQQQQEDFHRIMMDDVERLDSLINHLLDAAHVERGVEPAEDRPIRLDELLQQCATAAVVRYRLSEETVSLDSPPLKIESQLVQLEILFRNLIDNAVKYGGSPPSVTVKVSPVGHQQVDISIVDNGRGIPVNQRRKVFGRFVRLGNELERSRPGTGLGLYLVRNVVRAIGGSVRVYDRGDQSGGEVKGTEFVVSLKGQVTLMKESESQGDIV